MNNSFKSLLYLFTTLIPIVFALTSPEGSLSITSGAKSYLLLPTSKTMTLADAQSACKSIGGQLARLNSPDDIKVVGEKMGVEAAWIGGFLHHEKSGQAVAVFRGGAVAEPIDSEKSLLAVLCE